MQQSLGLIGDTVLLERAGSAKVSLSGLQRTGFGQPVKNHWLVNGSDVDNGGRLSSIIGVHVNHSDVAVGFDGQRDGRGLDVYHQKSYGDELLAGRNRSVTVRQRWLDSTHFKHDF